MSERTEWPSAEKLAQLREAGQASSSSISTRSASGAAALAALMLTLMRQSRSINDLIASLSTKPAGALLQELLRVALPLILIPALCAFIAGFASTLFQTRFLYAPVRLSPRFIRNHSYHAPVRAMAWNALIYLAILLVISACSAAICWLVGFDLLNCLNQSLIDGTDRLAQIWRTLLELAILLAIVLAALAAFVANLLFRHRNRMSRAELLSQRES